MLFYNRVISLSFLVMSPDLLNHIKIHLSNEIGQVVLYAVFATCRHRKRLILVPTQAHCAAVKYLYSSQIDIPVIL